MNHEAKISNKNISKKKSTNVKIPTKMCDKIRDNYNMLLNNINNHFNNNTNLNTNANTNNTSILTNKSNIKFGFINKTVKKSNLRSISHSSKCMVKMKEKDRLKDTSHNLSNTSYAKTTKLNSISNDNPASRLNKEPKDNYRKKNNKKYTPINTKDIFLNKNYNNANNNYDMINRSFNYFRKSQNPTNTSVKNIESSSYSDFHSNNNTQHSNKKKIFAKLKKSNKDINNNNNDKNFFNIPSYYFTNDCDYGVYVSNNNNYINYSNHDNYMQILQNLNTIPLKDLALKIVKLEKRDWCNELKENILILEKNKSINLDNKILNNFIQKRLLIQEDFNWLVWSIAYCFQKNIKISENSENNNYIKGFVHKNIFIKSYDKIENYKEIKTIKREIKSLNMLFLDYIQLLDNIRIDIYSINNPKSLLTNNILFPLISLVETSHNYILGSMVIDSFYSENDINNFNEINLNRYSSTNLQYSPFFSNLNKNRKNNLLKLNNGKYLLINISKCLHPLLIPEDESYNGKKIYLKYPLITNLINMNENYFIKSSFLNHLKYFINYISSNKYIIDFASLEYVMNKFGINKCFYLIILSKLKFNNSCDIDTNNNVASLIKIYILVKLITKIKNNKTNEGLFKIIICILSPKSPSIKIEIDPLIKELLTQCTNYLNEIISICKKLFINNDIEDLYKPFEFLKSLIKAARHNPLQFLRQIENKFNLLFNYEIKYSTSICLENFVKYSKNDMIIEKEPKIFTFINNEEIGFYLIIKTILKNQLNYSNYCYNKKGSKMMKNISSDNMEFYNGKYNIDNLSLLNRSIIQPRNSNFLILNNSKDKQKIKPISTLHMNTSPTNANINNVKNNNILENTIGNVTCTNSNFNFNNQYKNTQDNYSTDEKRSNVIICSSSKNICEFNYGDEETDKSFNFSHIESGFSTNISKQRNTTNLNNSKYNLNNNRNKNNVNNKTINAMTMNNSNYNTNSIISSSSSISINYKMNTNCNKDNKSQYWNSLFSNYHLKIPPILHKVITQNSKTSLLIYRYLSMYYSFYPFHFLNNAMEKNNLEISITNILNEIKIILENNFDNIISINSRSAYLMINFYIYFFINSYFVEENKIEQCQEILNKINDINKNKIIIKNNNYNIIINLLNGLIYEKIDFLKTEKYYSSALILSLIEYGEPRGRNNDGNNIMLFPVWKTGRNCMILDNNEILNENYKELYHCLFYLYENKRNNKIRLNDIKDLNLIDKNIINDLYRNIDYTKKDYKKNNINFLGVNIIKTIYEKNNDKLISDTYLGQNQYNQNIQNNQNEDTFFNFDENEMIERPSKADNNLFDQFNNINEAAHLNNQLNDFFNDNKNNIHTYNNYSTINNNIPILNPDCTFDIYFKENTTYPNVYFPSMSDKSTKNTICYFSGLSFFIYFFRAVFALINYSNSDLNYTEDYFNEQILSNNNNQNIPKNKLNSSTINNKILSEILYYKKYCQSDILVSFGNNTHCETSHKDYKYLSLPRIIYQLKNKEIISVNSGWEHSIAKDKNGMLYSWGNNSSCQCGFDMNETVCGNIISPKNIYELNNKNIIEVSCGNEHTLALSLKGDVYSWGSVNDGVLGRKINNKNINGLAKPEIIQYFTKNNIKIKHISSGSIHNLCLDYNNNIYSFGCSKGGQLGLEENKLLELYKEINNIDDNETMSSNSANISSNTKIKENKEKNFYITEPQLIENLKNIEIIKISSGEAHNVAIASDGKCYVWGFGSNGQLGLGFCEDTYPPGTGMVKSRIFTPTLVKYFENDYKIKNIFCGKTFSIFLNKKDELFSTGINDLNQCGIDNEKIIHPYFCYDITTPMKIEMFIRMKILNVSCGESHVLAIAEENSNKMLFSWGSNRFGQLGQGIQTKQSLPKIVNYFVHYNNSEVSQVSCGAFHSLALLRSKESHLINVELDEKFIFDTIDKIVNLNMKKNCN